MDPLLSIIKWILKKKNIENDDKSLDSFFDNGVSFPQFVSIIYDIEKIPNIRLNPQTLFHKKANNEVALQYLCQKNEIIRAAKPNIEAYNGKKNIILLILTRVCFTIQYQEIIEKSNILLINFCMDYKTKSDLMNLSYLQLLLNVLTDRKVAVETDINQSNFNEIMTKSFEIAQVPLFINFNSVKPENQEIFFIQIQIIFDIYSEKINELIAKPKTEENQEKNENDKNDKNDKNDDDLNYIKKKAQKRKATVTIKTNPIKLDQKTKDDDETNQDNTNNNNEPEKTDKNESIRSKLIKLSRKSTVLIKPNLDDVLQSNEDEKPNSESQNKPDSNKKPKRRSTVFEKPDLNDILKPKEKEKNKKEEKSKKDKKKKKEEKFKRRKTMFVRHEDAENSIKIDKESFISDEINDEEEESENETGLEFGEDERLEEESLLKTINFLAQKMFQEEKPNFISFRDTIKNDFIPKFVMKFLSIESIENVDLNPSSPDPTKLTKKNIKNVESVINFLRKKEKTFQILTFSFTTPSEREASSKLFFINFLNLFFVKKSRKEMCERLNIIASNSKSEFSISKNPRYKLIIESMKFLSQNDNSLNSSFAKMYEMCFELFSIANVFTNKQWNYYKHDKVLPNTYFYQLQLLFNEWDSSSKSYCVIETLFIARNKATKIKVPRYDIIASSIRAKNAAFELGIQISHLSQNYEKNDLNDNDQTEKESKEEKEKDQVPKCYNERHEKEKRIEKETNKNIEKKSSFIDDMEESTLYWNSPDNDYVLVNGEFIKKRNETDIQFDYKKVIDSSIKNEKALGLHRGKKANITEVDKQIFEQKKLNIDTKLYKIFYFDESLNEWKFDSDSFDEFSVAKTLNIGNTLTPLVFYANIKEEDLKLINSHFIIGQHPKVEDEEQIFVYALCEKNLAMLHIKMDFENQEKFSIKPIFLILHVPESKLKIPNLSTIIFQIYLYLSCISDLAFVLLNEKTIVEQISYFGSIAKIAQEYQNVVVNNAEEEVEDGEQNMNNINITFNQLNVIFLIKNESYECNLNMQNLLHNNSNFNKLVTQFNNKPNIALIDINQLESYNLFLDDMTIYLQKSQTRFSKIKSNFNCISLTNISSRYIIMRTLSNEKLLQKSLQDRYIQLISKKSFENTPTKALSQMYEEISIFTPQFDVKFLSKIQEIIFSLRKKASQIHREFFIKELDLSASLNYSKIINSIEHKNFISYDQMEKMVRNHNKFLRKEFFDIIKSKTDDSISSIVFEDNIDILQSQILKDKAKIDALFKDFLQKNEKRKEVVECDATDDSKKRTNFVLKETENLREIKVSVEVKKDLTSVIEQDF